MMGESLGQIGAVSIFLASQDALEVMRVTESLTHLLSVSVDFTDVTLVSEDTCRRPDPEENDESSLMTR